MIAFAYKVFYEVATRLSFSQAAEALCITQPAVSKQIKKLEESLGVPLFERKGSFIVLSLSGTKLLKYLKQARLLERQISSDLEVVKSQLKAQAELSVGASTTLSLYVLPRVLSSFSQKWPETKLTLINRNTENILKALVNRDIDLALVEDKHESAAMHYEFFMKDRIVPVCSSQSPYGQRTVKPEDLKNIPLAVREIGSGTLSAWSRKLSELGIKVADLHIKARLGGTEALKNFLVADEAMGFLSPLAIQREVELGLLKEVDIPWLTVERNFSFVTRTGETLTEVARSFIAEVRTQYNSEL